jgi:hypothetical protein
VALVLAPEGEVGLAMLELCGIETGTPSVLEDGTLAALRSANPAAESLPLLQALAAGSNASLNIAYLDESSIRVEVAK